MTTRFDWVATVLGAMFTAGLYLDGWAHTHGRVDETFFTPWHAVLYSGFLTMAILLIGRAAWGFKREGSLRGALPPGYGLGLIGVGCWFVGGPFDAVWHNIFGFEANIEALLSPAHAILALGFGLMTAGPLRAGFTRPPGRWIDGLPMLLSLTFVLSNLTFFTQIAHPVANLWAAGRRPVPFNVLELGITGMLLSAVVLTAPLLFLLAHARLPSGGVTIVIGLNSIAMGFLYDQGPYPRFVVSAFIAGAIVCDGLRAALQPAPGRPREFRVFAAALPAVLFAGYFIALTVRPGLVWSPHVWIGTVVFAAVIGWLLSYLVVSPPLAD
jgi:hypothetical protein